MEFLYYLLIFFVAVSAIIAILMATGVLHISVHSDSDMEDANDLPEEFRKLFDKENEEDKKQ